MEMRAISLHQPWASAVAYDAKRVETRSWATDYRGPLAIHAAKRFDVDEHIRFKSTWNWLAAVPPLKSVDPWKDGKPVVGEAYREYLHSQLPYGCIVAVCNLFDCRKTDDFTNFEMNRLRCREEQQTELNTWTEKMMGDFSLGRYGWILRNIKRLKAPIPYIGRQRFFSVEIPDSVEYA